MERVRVLIADDHTLFRAGLRQLLALEKDLHVVGEAGDGGEAVSRSRELSPDIILMDIGMPVCDGIAATRQVLEDRPETGIVILTGRSEDEYLFDAMRAGARGYLLKDTKPSDLVFAIRMVARGASLLDPRMTTMVLQEFRRLSSRQETGKAGGGLSARELEILRLVALGLTNKEIGGRLYLAEKTVKNCLSTIFQKLQINDRVQAAVYALKHGLAGDEDQRRLRSVPA